MLKLDGKRQDVICSVVSIKAVHHFFMLMFLCHKCGFCAFITDGTTHAQRGCVLQKGFRDWDVFEMEKNRGFLYLRTRTSGTLGSCGSVAEALLYHDRWNSSLNILFVCFRTQTQLNLLLEKLRSTVSNNCIVVWLCVLLTCVEWK